MHQCVASRQMALQQHPVHPKIALKEHSILFIHRVFMTLCRTKHFECLEQWTVNCITCDDCREIFNWITVIVLAVVPNAQELCPDMIDASDYA